MKIILDTSFLLTALKFKVDIFSELDRICDFSYKILIIDKTTDELKNKPNSKLALDLIKSKGVGIIKTRMDKNVDELILDIVDKDCIIATQDIELKKQLKDKGIRIITIRQKKYLSML